MMTFKEPRGLYDAEAQELLERLQARGLLLLVADGARGDGFSIILDRDRSLRVPDLLEALARKVRADLAKTDRSLRRDS